MIPFINKTILTLLLLFPLLGAFVLALLPQNKSSWVKKTVLSVFALEFLFSLYLPFHFSNTGITDQFFVEFPWLANWNIFYRLGIDGLSLVLILLTIVLMLLTSWRHQDRPTAILSLLLTSGLMGSFCSLDLFICMLFFQCVLLVIFFLLLHANTSPRPIILILLSSAALLTAVLMLASWCDNSFNLFQLMNYRLPLSEQRIIFGLFVFGFLIPVPISHLYRAHPETIFIPVLSLYGILRIVLPLLPNACQAFQSPWIITGLAIVAVVLLTITLITGLVFTRRLVTIIALCCVVVVAGFTAKPVWNLIERSAETVLLYMQSERTIVVTARLIQP